MSFCPVALCPVTLCLVAPPTLAQPAASDLSVAWESIGPRNALFYGLVVDADGSWYASHDDGLVVSDDQGESWSDLTVDGLQWAHSLIVDPRPGGAVYARHSCPVCSPPNKEVSRLREDRSGWEPTPCASQSFLFPPETPNVVSCAVLQSPDLSGFRSTDGGLEFTAAAIPASDFEGAEPILSAGLSGELSLSIDGGRTFELVPGPPVLPVAAIAVPAGTFFAATRAGAFSSHDGGETWTAIVDGLPHQPWRDLAIVRGSSDPDMSATVLLFGSAGLFEISGLVAERVVGGFSSGGGTLVDVSDPERILGSRLLTEDDGRSWREYITETRPEAALERHPLDPNLLVAPPSSPGKQVVTSRDAGRTWSTIPVATDPDFHPPFCRSFELDPTRVDAYFCLQAQSVYVTTDAGQSWARRSNVEETPPILTEQPGYVRRMAVGADGLTLVVLREAFTLTSDFEILVSRDGGFSWLAVGSLRATFKPTIVADHSDPNSFFAYSRMPGPSPDERPPFLARIDLEGEIQIDQTIFSGRDLTDFAQHASDPDRLLVANADGALFLSTDRGNSWGALPTAWSDEAGWGSVDWYNDTILTSNGEGVFRSVEGPPAVECIAGEETLCLNQQRFSVESTFQVGDDALGVGKSHPITDDTGAFWFFQPGNIELIAKILNGCSVNGHFWVFMTGLTDVSASVVVRDELTGNAWSSETAAGQAFPLMIDILAFPCQE